MFGFWVTKLGGLFSLFIQFLALVVCILEFWVDSAVILVSFGVYFGFGGLILGNVYIVFYCVINLIAVWLRYWHVGIVSCAFELCWLMFYCFYFYCLLYVYWFDMLPLFWFALCFGVGLLLDFVIVYVLFDFCFGLFPGFEFIVYCFNDLFG